MFLLSLRAYWQLMRCDFYLSRDSFSGLLQSVHNETARSRAKTFDEVDRVCHAIDLACIWYWKQVLCLQRSAATVLLLAERGLRAELVIGAQHIPFKAHAWVEVDGQVVNDKPYMREIYAVLDRC
jgi:transglutaminase superfamily protein